MNPIRGANVDFAEYAATIANGQAKTGVIDLAGLTLVGIALPTAFTGTGLTFECAEAAGGTFRPVRKVDGTSVDYTCAQGDFVAIDPKDFHGVRFLKIVSDANEAAQRSVLVYVKKF